MIVYGKNVFNETDPKTIRRVKLSPTFKDQEIMKKIKDNHIKYMVTDQRDLDRIALHNQGIVIEINDYEYKDLSVIGKDEKIVLLLDHLEDPHNFGAIIRTCEARGIKSVIIPKDRSVAVNDTVMKTSAGALNRVNIIMVPNLVNAINKLKDEGFFVYASAMDGRDYKKVSYSDRVVLIIGNEGKGISKIVRDNSDEIISIPMIGSINSLNASVAAGILMYGIEN
ncbi:MAG: 23S rRNA (guanosine(2251)-2'-O)-methyltransferase RlmB [Bacilli bacterium]|nr:23S rRNA (guanosine(2251)-2'-O)-methyltransferase RlmB [Bacilli bacterium]